MLRRRLVLLPLALALVAGTAAAATPVKQAPRKHVAKRLVRRAADANLLANGSFEGSLAGWGGYRASLALAVDGVVGTDAAKVTLASTNLSDGFSIYPDALVKTSAGTVYVAGGSVRSATPGRQVCLRIRERNTAGGEVGGSSACVKAASTWASFGTASYTAKSSGDNLDVYAYEWAPTKGDSFEVDGLTLAVPSTSPAPAPSPTPPPAGIAAAAVDNAHIALTWAPVAGASSYRVARGGLVVGTTTGSSFTDALLWPETQYSYTVTALDGAGATVGTLTAAATTTALPAAGFPSQFPSSSLWSTPIGPAPVLATDNGALSSFFAANALHPNMTLHDWGVSVVESHATDPAFTVPCTLYSCTLGAFGAFRIPATAAPDPSGDGHMVVYDPGTQREWDFWQAAKTGSGWSASAGAAVSDAGNGIVPAGTAGADAANMPLLGGLVRPEEILQGHIDHALVFGMPNVNSTRAVCPATHHDGGSTDPSSLPEGTRLQLDPSIDVSSLGLPSWEVPIARAMQVYGMYLRDTGGSFAIYAEDPAGRGYDAWAKVGLPATDAVALTGIPWSRFRVIAPPSC